MYWGRGAFCVTRSFCLFFLLTIGILNLSSCALFEKDDGLYSDTSGIVGDKGSDQDIYLIGGVIEGLEAGPLKLTLNQGPVESFTDSGEFIMRGLADGNGYYAVEIYEQPPFEICTIYNQYGQLSGEPVQDIVLACAPSVPFFKVSATVQGLNWGKSVFVQLNDYAPTQRTENGLFEFSKKAPNHESYEVVVSQQPEGGHCEVINGTGIINSGDVNDVIVDCVQDTPFYEIDVTVTGIDANCPNPADPLIVTESPLGGAAENSLGFYADGTQKYDDLFIDGFNWAGDITQDPTGCDCNFVAPGTGKQIAGAINGGDAHWFIQCEAAQPPPDACEVWVGVEVNPLVDGGWVTFVLDNLPATTTIANDGYDFLGFVPFGESYEINASYGDYESCNPLYQTGSCDWSGGYISMWVGCSDPLLPPDSDWEPEPLPN